ncbi:hypothetical protein GCM10010512_07360 [Streptomyces thermoviolaceus subsp. thermoviolaceus]|nr:hypothetical protein GCM10010512_07360 [Streptomyces thermoviolaceus subsp. thermoviolaceus]
MKTAAATAATVAAGSGARDSSTCDAVPIVTTTAVNSAARTALSWVPDMSIAVGQCGTGAGKRFLKKYCATAPSPTRNASVAERVRDDPGNGSATIR